MSSEPESFEQVRKSLRVLETSIDQNLGQFSKLVHAPQDLNQKPFGNSLQQEISSDIISSKLLLDKLICHPSASLQSHIIVHHKEKSATLEKDWKRLESIYQSKMDRMNLLSMVKQDINDQYNNRNHMDTLLRERGSLNQSERISDRIIDQGHETHEKIKRQNQVLHNNLNLLGEYSGSLSSIQSLMRSIKRKRTRDCTILSAFVAFCICVLLWWWLSRF